MGRADVEARAKRDADIVRAKERAAAEAEEAERMAAHLLTVVDGKIESAEATVAEAIDRQGQARADHEAAIAARARAEEVEHTHDESNEFLLTLGVLPSCHCWAGRASGSPPSLVRHVSFLLDLGVETRHVIIAEQPQEVLQVHHTLAD